MRHLIFYLVFVFNIFGQNTSFIDKYHFDDNNILYRKTANNLNENIQHRYSTLNLFGQTVAGYAAAVGFSALPYYLAGENNPGSDYKTGLIIFSVLTYLTGSATGVYFVSNIENPKISFLETLGYSALGGLLGFVTASATFNQRDPSPFGIILFFAAPTISSMIYSSFVADWPENRVGIRENTKTVNDFIEKSKLFNVQLLRINF